MRHKSRIVIIDYGVGNRGSIQNMVRVVGGIGVIANDSETIRQADRLILPGVGAFDACVERFNNNGLTEILHDAVFNRGIPILGLCVGMQMLFESSEEGKLPGLGWLKGRVRHLSTLGLENGTKIPNMGWRNLRFIARDPIFGNQPATPRFYFAHSYFCDPADGDRVLAEITYGSRSVPVAVRRDNIVGVQFHPEKSHVFGKTMIEAFIGG